MGHKQQPLLRHEASADRANGDFVRPRAIVFVPTLLRTAKGKLMRAALKLP